MEDNIKARAARKLIRKINDELNEELSMDLAMDGSGDCSKMIYDHYIPIWNKRIDAIFSLIGLSKEYYREYLRCAMQIEGHYTNAFNSCPDAYYDLCTLEAR